MKVSRAKWEALKARGRNVGRRLGGVKGSAIDALVGVVAYQGHKMAGQKGFLQTNWWAGPAIMAVGGHVLKKKGKTQSAGSALLGAAGYAGMMGYELNKASKSTETTKGLTQPSEVQGLVSPADPYDMDTSDATSSFVETTGYGDDDGSEAGVDYAEALGM